MTFCPLIVLQRDHAGVTLVNSPWSLVDNHVNRRTIGTKEFISTFRRLSWPLIVLQRDHFGVTAVICSRFVIDNHDSDRQLTKEFSYIVISALLLAFACWMFCVFTRPVQFCTDEFLQLYRVWTPVWGVPDEACHYTQTGCFIGLKMYFFKCLHHKITLKFHVSRAKHCAWV